MKRVIIASTGSKKVTGQTWDEFCNNVKDQWGFDVDGADRRRYSKWICLIKDNMIYDAEVTKYSDGTYELMYHNITEAELLD